MPNKSNKGELFENVKIVQMELAEYGINGSKYPAFHCVFIQFTCSADLHFNALTNQYPSFRILGLKMGKKTSLKPRSLAAKGELDDEHRVSA